MPLRLTSAPVSGIKKRKTATTHRSRASPFSAHARSKPHTGSGEEEVKAVGEALLPDIGPSRYIANTAPVENVIQAIRYIKDSMWEPLPARAGMNSTRIAHVLNFRRSLPPLASVAHVHMLLQAPTLVEKEIIDVVRSGQVRRLIVPGRGSDAAGLGDCLVLTEEWEMSVRSGVLDSSLQDRFLRVLAKMTDSTAVPAGSFPSDDMRILIHGGFLVSASSLSKGSLNLASLPAIPSIAPAASESTGSNTQQTSESDAVHDSSKSRAATMFLSLPNTGPYLRLLSAGRSRLLALLRKSAHQEVPLDLLRDRWNGAVETDKSFSLAKRARGEFAGVLPGRTKKWKELYGMSFRWALEEALGAGLIELFDTGSVGPGVRVL
ncbi:hypothetical protein Egran_05233 [Elaphomyces granulatus]|uniref:Serine-threonine protein kinase 19 n=1 Tax=Elaphomyces granulatus TaxID=519963 RepID=A0A232LS66_9EURO|nr:hypothetical protein Egran_05233 [Elaphomyces granulatus]